MRCAFHDFRCAFPQPQLLIGAEIIILLCRGLSYKAQPLSHASLANMSSPSCVPVFDVHSHRQDGQLGFQGWFYDGKANAYITTHHAAGSVRSPPLPSTSPPSLAFYSFDQWNALLNTDCSSNLYAGCSLAVPFSDPSFSTGSRDLELSPSCNSSYVALASLLALCTVLPHTLARPHHQWHHLRVVTVSCISLPQTCSRTLCRALLKRAMSAAKTLPLQYDLTKITLSHGPSQ
jgi:hypothetical protein